MQLPTGELLPWLLVVCRDHARNLARRSAEHAGDELPEELAASAVRGGSGRAPVGSVTRIAALPEADRLICELCLVRGYSYAEARSSSASVR